MKFTTIALATALALTSSGAFARANYARAARSHVMPPVDSYVAPAVGLVHESTQLEDRCSRSAPAEQPTLASTAPLMIGVSW